MRWAWQIALACTWLLGACEQGGAAETLDHGRFDDVRLFVPKRATHSVVLLLSDQTWSAADDALAQRLQSEGALVAGIDTETFQRRIASEDTECSLPAGDLENLAHFVQAYRQLSSYRPAILAGSGTGASLAYATLAQSVTGTFAGVLAFDFCPELPPMPRICAGAGLPPEARPTQQWLQVNAERPEPQLFFQPATTRACSSRARIPEFFAASQAKHVAVTSIAALLSESGRESRLHPALAALARRSRDLASIAPLELGELPIVEVPATGAGHPDLFAVFLSGDGGWAGLDEEVADRLAAQGVPVVGIDSLRYFWTARTPEGMATDVDRVIAHYARSWHRSRVALLGYSQGGDVLPFIVNRLSRSSRAALAVVAPMAIGRKAHFEFHVTNWLGDEGERDILPEMTRLSGQGVLCIHGKDEEDSLCPLLDARGFEDIELPGGHHFDGDYARLSQAVLAAADRSVGGPRP